MRNKTWDVVKILETTIFFPFKTKIHCCFFYYWLFPKPNYNHESKHLTSLIISADAAINFIRSDTLWRAAHTLIKCCDIKNPKCFWHLLDYTGDLIVFQGISAGWLLFSILQWCCKKYISKSKTTDKHWTVTILRSHQKAWGDDVTCS